MNQIIFTGDFAPHCRLRADYFTDSCLIGNLEVAFSDKSAITGKAYTSVLPESAMSNMGALPFSALNLANNHVYDAGNFEEMYFHLKKCFPSIQFFGTEERPYAEFLSDHQKIAIIGCLESCRSRGSALFPEEEVLSLIFELKSAFQKVYVYPHWGKECEYTRYPSPRQMRLAHAWIDAGANGVFGHHSHVYQGKETYKDKPVYYSLGNFFFPHPESALYEGTHTGMTIELNLDSDQLTEHFHAFDGSGIRSIDQNPEKKLLEGISLPLLGMTNWKWAQKIGAFYLRKNMASWRIRIRRKPLANLPKFLIWSVLPRTVMFFTASMWNNKK